MFFKTQEIIKEVKVVDETRVKELEHQLKQVKIDFASEKRILEAELKIKINDAVVQKDTENNILKQENAVLKARVEVLEKAFENMGFDVKDMKDILNKLVDGIVSKNTIQLVRGLIA